MHTQPIRPLTHIHTRAIPMCIHTALIHMLPIHTRTLTRILDTGATIMAVTIAGITIIRTMDADTRTAAGTATGARTPIAAGMVTGKGMATAAV